MLSFDDGGEKLVDLAPHLDGEIFELLKDIAYFKTVRVDPDIRHHRVGQRRGHGARVFV